MPEIVMPQLGESVTEGTITQWFKNIGESVTEDEPLFEVSTDKVDSEVPSPATGVLTEIRVPEGDTVDVGTVLAVLGDAGDVPAAPAESPAAEAPAAEAPAQEAPAPEAPAASAAPAPAAPAPAAPAEDTPAQAAPASAPAGGQPPMLSPLVRRLVEENGLDPATITGTGVGGRITREDVLGVIDSNAQAATAPAAPAAAPAPSAPAAASAPRAAAPASSATGDERVALNNIRLRTGEHMVKSLATSPHVITAIAVDYERVETARRAEKDAFAAEEGFSLTYLPFISRAVVDAIEEFPHINATVGDGELIVHHGVNLNVAVDLDHEGLLAPVVKGADGLRLRAIAREISTLAANARSRQLGPDDLSGGTFTLSNSGSYGTLLVAPIINQPQVAILSTDGISRQPVVVELDDGTEAIAIHSVGNLTLSWDHRAFDGAYAAAFMQRVKEILETRDWAEEL